MLNQLAGMLPRKAFKAGEAPGANMLAKPPGEPPVGRYPKPELGGVLEAGT
jgi:hypothetical protein